METLKRQGMSGQSPIPTKPKHHKPGSKGSSRAPTPDVNKMAYLMDVPDMDLQGLIMNPLDPDSYLAHKNMADGLDPEENKNQKVTLELLQQMEIEDINTVGDEKFTPEDVLPPPEIETDDDESVFNYLFPQGLGKKKGKKERETITKNKYSEKIYNMKKEKGGKSSKTGKSKASK